MEFDEEQGRPLRATSGFPQHIVFKGNFRTQVTEHRQSTLRLLTKI